MIIHLDRVTGSLRLPLRRWRYALAVWRADRRDGRPVRAWHLERLRSACFVCGRVLWPWQRQGFYTTNVGPLRWHAPRCIPAWLR